MGTLPRTLVKWEIVSGYLWGHYTPLAKGTALNKDLASAEYRENGAESKRLLTLERLQRDDVQRWFPYAIGGKAPSDKAPLAVPVRIGKEDKYIPAKWKDPSRWATYKAAVTAASEIDGKSGVGIMLGLMTNRAICGIDLDSCIEDGEFAPWAKPVIDRLKTYAEISPSGTGAKLFFLIPADKHVALKTLLNEHGKKFEFSKLKHGPAIEIYAEGRFFTVTGNKCSADDTLAVLSVSDIEWLVGHAKTCRKDGSFIDVLGDEPAVKSDEAAWIAEIQRCSPKTHDSLLRLATKRAFEDVNKADIVKELRSLLSAVPAELRKRDDGSDRWTARYASVSKIAADAVKFKGKTEAETLERLNDIKFDDLTGEDEDASDITDLGSFDLSENGLIEMFRNNFRSKLRFDFDAGKWFVWNGNRWERNSTQVAHEYARQVSTRVAAVDSKNPAAKSLKRVGTWEAVERGARRVSPLAVTADTWDADPWLLGTPDGSVDLRTGQLRQAQQQDFITKQTAVAPIPLSSFDPARDCPTWLSFLDFATGSDAGAIRFLQQWLGYSLTGDTREQALLFVHGPGGSGKGTAINGFADVMGDYATNVDMSTLTAAKYEGHTTQFARLRGARMARASETEEGKAWAENRIKTLTGGDKVTARFMRQDDFEFVPEFKLTIFGNNRPAIANVDEAIKRRFNVLPFTRIPTVKDLELGAKLRAEWAGMLSWAILGCLDWQKNGLARPQIVLDATANYFEEQDTFQLWIEAECELGKVYADTTDRLWDAWMNYARDVGEPCGSRNKTFPEMMQRRGYRPIRDTMGIRGRGFAGIRVRETDDLFENLESNL